MLLDDAVKSTVQDAAKKLTGHRKRDFMAKVAEDYLQGSARKAERVLGWNRKSVELGLHERCSGLVCVDNYRARGTHKSEDILPQLEEDIRGLVDQQTQADPKFQTVFCLPALVPEPFERHSLPRRDTPKSNYRLAKPLGRFSIA